MSKKAFIILTTTLSAILIVLIGYYFIMQDNQNPENGNSSGFRSFFPFGGNESATSTPREVTEEVLNEEEVNFTKKLRKLSSEPVSGAGIVDVKAGSVVRYIEKGTGHIYEVELFSPIQNRISNTTIPLAYDAIWGNKNLSLMARYLKEDDFTVDTYGLTIKNMSTTTENTVSATSFPTNITDISSLGSSIFYLQKNNDSSVGYISDFAGRARKQIWNSDIKELSSQYVNARTVALTTKPAQNIPGFMYLVDTNSGQVKKALGNIYGLSALSDPDTNQILFISQGDELQMYLSNQKTKTYTGTTPATFPEKCVWSKKDKSIIYCAVPKEFLDGGSQTLWYKGLISYSDDIWKYDTKNNTSSVIVDLYEESAESIDVIKPILSENEQYLIFTNRNNDSLWSLDLTK